MTKRSIIQSLAATAVVGVLGVGIIVPAMAQDNGDGTTTTEETSLREAIREERRAEFAAALAEELGLDSETVATAIETVREELRAAHQAERQAVLRERLAEAVEAGELTQEQADAIVEAHEAGVLGGRRGGGHRGLGGPGGPGGPGF